MIFRPGLHSLGDAVPDVDAEPAQLTPVIRQDEGRQHARHHAQFLCLALRQRGRGQGCSQHPGQNKAAY
jgi:hypothetical protein